MKSCYGRLSWWKRDWEWCGGAGGAHAGPMLGLSCWLPTFPKSPGCLLGWVSGCWNMSRWSWVVLRFGASEGAPRSYSTVAAWCKASRAVTSHLKINHGPDFIAIGRKIWFQKWLCVIQKIAMSKKKNQRCWYPKSVPEYIIGLLSSSLNPLSKLQLISQIKEERSFARPCLLSHAEAVVIF